jgi:hypothetical protein
MVDMMMVDFNHTNDLDLESFAGDWQESAPSSSSLADRHLDEVSRNLFNPGSSPGYVSGRILRGRLEFRPEWNPLPLPLLCLSARLHFSDFAPFLM